MERLGLMVRWLNWGIADKGVRGNKAAMSLFPCEKGEDSQAKPAWLPENFSVFVISAATILSFADL